MNEEALVKQARRWYWGGDDDVTTAIHWEIFKAQNGHELAFIGEKARDRFLNMGGFKQYRQELAKRTRKMDPRWHVFRSIPYARRTVTIEWDTWVDLVDAKHSAEEIADHYGVVQDVVEKRIDQYQRNRLTTGQDLNIPADFTSTEHWRRHEYDQTPYDLPVDIDGDGTTPLEKMMDAYQKAKTVKRLFDENNVPYAVKFSGGKGFHFLIDRDTIVESSIETRDYGVVAQDFGEFLADRTGLTYGKEEDLDQIHNRRKLWRVPYTIHPDTGLVVLPLTDDQFQAFDDPRGTFHPKNVRDTLGMEIKNRGMQFREGDTRFLDEFQEWREAQGSTREDDIDPADPGELELADPVDRVVDRVRDLDPDQRQEVLERIKDLDN